MKIFIIALSLFLAACSPTLIDEKPSKALEYAHSLLNLKIQERQLNNELHQAEVDDKVYEEYERNTLPNLVKKHQETLIKSQEEYLTSYKEYVSRVAGIKKSNEDQRLSIKKYNNLALAEYNKAKTVEDIRVRGVNKSLSAEYDANIQKELPKQKERIDKMKTYEKEQLEVSIIENRKIYSSLSAILTTPTNSDVGRKRWGEAMKDISVDPFKFLKIVQPNIGLPEHLVSQAKSLYESSFRTCINNSLDRTCKKYTYMSKRGVLVIPKLYSKESFESALAINTIPKLTFEKASYPEVPALKEVNLIDVPTKPIKPLEPRKPKNPFISKKNKIRQLQDKLMDITEKFSRLNNLASNNGLDVNWDNVLHKMKENNYWKISEKTFRDDALIVIMKNNLN